MDDFPKSELMECGPETGGLGLQGAVSGSEFFWVRISMSCGLHVVMHLRVGCMGSMRLRTYLDHLGSVELMKAAVPSGSRWIGSAGGPQP